MSTKEYRRLRYEKRMSRYAIGERGGRSREEVRQVVVAQLEDHAQHGVHLRETSPWEPLAAG